MNIINMPQNVRTMTFTLSGETLINFANDYDSVAVRSDKEIGISEYSDKQIGDNGVLKCNKKESVIYPNLIRKRYIYIVGANGANVEIFVGNGLVINPFKNGGKGGDDTIVHYLGVTTTPLSDNSTANPILINGIDIYAENADWAVYNSKDYIFNGTIWQEFMDLSNYYTKSETDTLLFAKANSADVYTKTQADDLFVAQEDIDIKETPTTAEINAAIADIWGA